MPFQATVLFPSSPPPDEANLAQALVSSDDLKPGIELHWPREIACRRQSDPNDYLAGSDQVRCRELIDFYLCNQRPTAWFGRGGFGATRLLRLLDAEWPEQRPNTNKRWMGYSDITALFAFSRVRELAIECIHGPMVCALHRQPNRPELLEALAGNPCAIPYSPTAATRSFSAPIWGGNLAVLASLCGTPWLPRIDEESCIFLEDVDESPYRVDRYLTQLFDSGFLSVGRRVLLGTFTGFQPESAVLKTAKERSRELGLEIVGKVPVGHSEPHSPLFLDRPYRFDTETRKLIPVF